MRNEWIINNEIFSRLKKEIYDAFYQKVHFWRKAQRK